MIKPEQIPDEVAKAADAAYYDTAADPRWSDEHLMKTAIAAALNAWPNAKTLRDDGRRQTYIVPALVLPLAQEARDD